MKSPACKIVFQTILLVLLLASKIATAETFEGEYRETTTNQPFKIIALGDDRFEIKSSDWQGVAFWDPRSEAFKGIFRFKNTPKLSGSGYKKSGKAPNTVGYHSYKMLSGGGIFVTYQWSLNDAGEGGTFELVRME